MEGECVKLALLCAAVILGSLSVSFVIAASRLPANCGDEPCPGCMGYCGACSKREYDDDGDGI